MNDRRDARNVILDKGGIRTWEDESEEKCRKKEELEREVPGYSPVAREYVRDSWDSNALSIYTYVRG